MTTRMIPKGAMGRPHVHASRPNVSCTCCCPDPVRDGPRAATRLRAFRSAQQRGRAPASTPRRAAARGQDTARYRD